MGRNGRATLADIARLAKVDSSTVSLVLNRKPLAERLFAETRERIFAAARELNYQPSFAARTLKTGKSGAFGMVVGDLRDPYYSMLENETVVNRILAEFGLPPEGTHIINGHVPVKSKNGENPIKCGGKVMVIDGGFSKAYQKETGIAGYTLIYNSYGLILAAHEPFESTEAAIEKESDIHSDSIVVKRVVQRKMVGDTDIGRELKEQIRDLETLLEAYRSGRIAERL